MVVNQTPFYGESGGQVGDTGTIAAQGLRFRVTNTRKKLGDLFVHDGIVERARHGRRRRVELEVDHARRARNPRQPLRDASAA